MTDSLEWLADGDLFSVPGWSGSAVRAGIKPSGDLDLAVMCADGPRTASAVFTRNALPAAPIVLARETLAESREVRTIVVNAGNANALTGENGMRDARAMKSRAEKRCGGPAIVLSTGIIGVPMPMERIFAGIDAAADSLTPRAPEVAAAILTTDTTRKTCAVQVRLDPDGDEIATVGGVAKGSGMIHPNMATMLAFVAIDEPVEAPVLDGILRRAVDASFHEISVDGDTSTNDTVLLLAGGGSRPPVTEGDPRLPAVELAITKVMQRLARAIVDDGEGRTRTLELEVRGAASTDDARRVAESIVRSALVKTALAGGDPNWGRILAAAANAGVTLAPERLTLDVCGTTVYERGGPTRYDTTALDAEFARPEVSIELDLGAGDASARRLTSDLSAEYVRINSEYTT